MSAAVGTEYEFPPNLLAIIERARDAERLAQREIARRHYDTVLTKLDRSAPQCAIAAVMRWIGRTHIDDADLDAALDRFTSALAISQQARDLPGVAHAYNLMAIVHQQRGDLDDAERWYLRAHDTARAVDELALAAMIDQNLGTLANIRGDLELALAHYRTSLSGYRALEMPQRVGPLLNNLGMLYTDLRKWEQAEGAYNEAAEQCIACGDMGARIMVEVNRAELWIARREFTVARASCDTALELATQSEDVRALGETYKHYGVIARETNDNLQAEEFLGRAISIADERGDLLLAAEAAREQAELFQKQDRNRDTLISLNRAHRLFTQLQAKLDLADIDRRMDRLETMFLEIVRRWGASIESKDQYTQGHCERVTDYAVLLAKAARFDESTIFWFRMGALLHDVGKIAVPSEVLNKPGRLTPEERALMELHPVAGVDLLAGIDFPWDIRPMVRHHHEWWDGSGYPDKLAGEDIPLSARILCIADVYDALTTDRPYRQGFSHEKAMEIMEGDVGRLFDPELFAHFREIVDLRLPAKPASLAQDEAVFACSAN